jgi:hypothetical protein
MRAPKFLKISSLAILLFACAKEPATEAPWEFPLDAFSDIEIKSDTLLRQTLFLLYTVDGEYQDTLSFKPQVKESWQDLFKLSRGDASQKFSDLQMSCPGSDGHLEIHSKKIALKDSVQMEFADSLSYTDFFRIIDRRVDSDLNKKARIYQGVNVNLYFLGARVYPLDSAESSYSGHCALYFSGLFSSRHAEHLHEIEGYLGAW